MDRGTTIRHLILTAVLLAGLTEPAWAGWNEASFAFRHGDYETAFREFKPLAEQGHADAQTNIGLLYENGQGVPQNYGEAVKWYRKAAEQGYADAQKNLGVMYADGAGVPQNYGQAARW